MLLVLDSTSRTLRAKMSDAPSSVQCSVTVTYADTTATTFVEGMYPIQLNGTTLVTILPAPASGTRRVVKSVMFFNDDTMTHTITLYLTDNITDYPITKITLPPGSSWASDDQTGVNVGGAVTDGSKGDISVSNGGDTWTIANSAVTLAKMADLPTDRLIGRDTAGTGVPEQISVTGGVEFTGSGSIQVGAFSGDVAKTAGSSSLTISNNAVTYAKMQDVSATSRVIGRKTASAGDPEECTLSEVLDFVGSAAQGDLLYRGASTWTRLGAGTSGQYLQTQGASANPQWASVTGGGSAFKNVLINGDMQIFNRVAHLTTPQITGITTDTVLGTSQIDTGYFTADRWRLIITSAGTWTQAVVNDRPSNSAGSIFEKALKMTCTTANASPIAAADVLAIEQRIEGQNVQHFLKGQSNAVAFALSFWVKANVTGTYIAELLDQTNTRKVSASYTIGSADTWTEIKISFPADTTGIIANDRSGALVVRFYLAAGSDLSGGTLQTTWSGSANANTRAAGQVNVSATANNYWQITGVQLEPTTHSAFEKLPTDIQLLRCLRYLGAFPTPDSRGSSVFIPGERYFGSIYTGNDALIYFPFLVPLRKAATAVYRSNDYFGIFSVQTAANTVLQTTTFSINVAGQYVGIILAGPKPSTASAGTVCWGFPTSSTVDLGSTPPVTIIFHGVEL
jgi:Repeat of unknown function (DUF5907)